MFRLKTCQYIFPCRKHPYFHDKQNYDGVSGKIRLCVEKTISKTRIFCPSEAKNARFQASLSSPVWRGTMPAQPSNGFFHPEAFTE
jgi:hypothetical protein